MNRKFHYTMFMAMTLLAGASNLPLAVADMPAVILECDGEKKEFTIDDKEVESNGWADTQAEAITRMLERAVAFREREDVFSQFQCKTCPKTERRCRQVASRSSVGQSYAPNPVCTIEVVGKRTSFHCEGKVLLKGATMFGQCDACP